MTLSARELLQSATDATESKKATLCKASPMPDGSEAVVVTAGTVSTPVMKMCGIPRGGRRAAVRSGAAMNGLGRTPCAIAGSGEPLLDWPPWSPQ
jgi:hypothetical protein